MVTKEQYIAGCELWRCYNRGGVVMSSFGSGDRSEERYLRLELQIDSSFFASREDAEACDLENALKRLNDRYS